MVKNTISITKKEAQHLYWILSKAQLTFEGKDKTLAIKYFKKFGEVLFLSWYGSKDEEK